METRQANASDAGYTCKQCGEDIGRRKVVVTDAGARFHAKDCWEQHQEDEREQRRLERQAEEEAERQRVKALREKVKAQRGSLTEFAERAWSRDLSEGEQQVSSMARLCLQKVGEFEAERDKHVAKLTGASAARACQDLGWSKSLFQAAAQGAVAGEILEWIEFGLEWNELKAEIERTALSKARSAASTSTSATSNLIDTMLIEAWARFANRFWI